VDLIRPLEERDLGAWAELRRRALAEEPLAFAASPETDVVVQIGKAPDWMLFGAFAGETLVGSVGMIRSRHPKAAHKMHVWGMYVLPTHRRRGLAARLLDAAIAHARSTPGVEWLQLGVTDDAAEAKRVYEKAGFVVWGYEPDALRFEGRAVGEEHMALRIR
jgi:ribosomal protein S18 acetylase RimI-like enzyme